MTRHRRMKGLVNRGVGPTVTPIVIHKALHVLWCTLIHCRLDAWVRACLIWCPDCGIFLDFQQKRFTVLVMSIFLSWMEISGRFELKHWMGEGSSLLMFCYNRKTSIGLFSKPDSMWFIDMLPNSVSYHNFISLRFL